MRSTEEFRVARVRRSANGAAHWLAKEACANSFILFDSKHVEMNEYNTTHFT